MNAMQRVVAALNHQEADRVPVYPILSGVTRTLVGASYKTWATDAAIYAKAMTQSVKAFGLDCVVSLIDLSVECEAWGQEVIYPDNEAAHPNYKNCIIKGIEDYAKVKRIDYRQGDRMAMHVEACRQLVADAKGEYPVVAFVFGPLGVLSMMRGQQDMFMDLYDDPDAVKTAAAEIAETLKDYCRALMETGINGIMLDTLFASGSIMSKAMWMEMEGGLCREIADVIRQAGGLVMIHNCGKRIYFDAQIESMDPVAISFLYPPDDCADFSECKQKYGHKTTLIGCVTPATAVIGTDEQWDAECREALDTMASGGGFMLATGCEYPANAPLDKARRMVEIAHTYGKYSK